MKHLSRLIAVLIMLSLLLGACAPQATQPPAQPPAEEAAPPEDAPADEAPPAEAAPADPMSYLDAPREDTVIFDQPYKLETTDNWNPYTPGNASDWGMTQIAMDGMMYLNYGDGEYVMWMAENVESNDDATEWTLTLRKGITWQDGAPFTADDVVYSINLQMEHDTLGNHFYFVEWLKSVDKMDDFTVKFTLNKPNVRFAAERFGGNLGLFQDKYVPKHIWEKVEDPNTFKNFDLANGLPMGTGAYIIAKVTTNEVILVRNDNWWAAKTGLAKLPEPKKVVYSYVGTEEVRTQAAINNDFDSMQDITVGALEAILAQNPSWEAWYQEKPYSAPDPCARIISLNSAKEPWNDKDMRKMLSYVMDRQQIVDIAYEGSTTLAAYYWPAYPSMQPYNDLIPTDLYNSFLSPQLDEAEAIMLDKGYVKGDRYWAKDGQDLTLEIQVPEDFIELTRIGDVYVEQLQRFGINANVMKLGGVYYDNSSTGDYEAQSNWFACGSINEPWSTLRQFAGEAAPLGERAKGGPVDNQWRWHNQEYTDIVAEIGVTKLDDPKLLELTERALEILYDELPALPAAQSRKIVPFNNTYWTGWPTQENYYIWPCNWCSVFTIAMTKLEKAK